MMVGVASCAVQENHCRTFLPLFRAGKEAAIGRIVFWELGWTWRRKTEAMAGLGRIELRPRWPAFCGNKVRTVQKCERFFKPRVERIAAMVEWRIESPAPNHLKGGPIQEFCSWRNHAWLFRPASNLGASQRTM